MCLCVRAACGRDVGGVRGTRGRVVEARHRGTAAADLQGHDQPWTVLGGGGASWWGRGGSEMGDEGLLVFV